jgi:hypothetical protein
MERRLLREVANAVSGKLKRVWGIERAMVAVGVVIFEMDLDFLLLCQTFWILGN